MDYDLVFNRSTVNCSSKIELIKALRVCFPRLGLYESKCIIDQLEGELNKEFTERNIY